LEKLGKGGPKGKKSKNSIKKELEGKKKTKKPTGRRCVKALNH